MDNLRKTINNNYTKGNLATMYARFFQKPAESGKILKYMKKLKTTGAFNLEKEDLVDVFSKFLSDKDIFQEIFNKFSKYLKKIFVTAVWEEKVNILKCEELFNINIISERSDSNPGNYILEPDFSFFTTNRSISKKDLNLILPNELTSNIKSFLPKPKGYYLEDFKLPKGLTTVDMQQNTVDLICSVVQFLNETKDFKNLNIAELSSAYKIDEFFPDYEMLKYSRSEIMFSLLYQMLLFYKKPKSDNYKDNLEMIYNVLTESKFSGSFLEILLKYIKKTKEIDEIDISNTIKTLIKNIPSNKWISVKNIEKYIKYNCLPIQIISYYDAGTKCLVKNKKKKEGFVTNSKYYETIAYPFLLKLILLLASFGFLEIAYKKSKKIELLEFENDWTLYDSIVAVRKTQIGAFFSGDNENLAIKPSKREGEIEIHESELNIISIYGDLPEIKILLEKTSKQISKNRYMMNYESLVSNLDSLEQLKEIIGKLKKIVFKNKVPANFKKLFNNALKSTSIYKTVEEVTVVKFHNNHQILNTIIEDWKIKNLILLAEKTHAIVYNKDLKKFEKRLRELGYGGLE